MRLNWKTCCRPIVETVADDVYWANFARSRIAWEEARTRFLTPDGKYTDDYGGVFIDKNGIFNISVVGNYQPVKSDYLIYRQVSNSFNLLIIATEVLPLGLNA